MSSSSTKGKGVPDIHDGTFLDPEEREAVKKKYLALRDAKPDGSEAYALRDWFTFFTSPDGLYYHGVLLTQLTIREWGRNTFAVALDSSSTGRLNSHRRFFYWGAKPVRVILDCGGTKALKKMKQIIAHESLHILLRHFARMFDFLACLHKDEEKWLANKVSNRVMDWEINVHLVKHNYWSEGDNKEWDPMPGTYPEHMGFRTGYTFEQYTHAILREWRNDPEKLLERFEHLRGPSGEGDGKGDADGDPQQGQAGGQGSGQPGEGQGASGGQPGATQDQDPQEAARQKIRDMLSDEPTFIDLDLTDGKTPAELSRMARDANHKTVSIVRNATNALQSNKSRGLIPGDVQELINEIHRQATVPWQQELQAHVKTGALTGRGITMQKWSKPKAAMARHMQDSRMPIDISIFPGLGPAPTPKVLFGIDTSGSVGDLELTMVYAEVREIADHMGADMWVAQCDSRLQDFRKCDSVRELQRVGFRGRGGTVFDPIFALAKKMNVDVLIYFTDGYAPLPSLENRIPDNKLIWLLTPSPASVIPGTSSNNLNDCEYGKCLRIRSYDE